MVARSSSDVDYHVGRRVRERRVALGITQGKLGETLGVSYQQVQKYENGSSRVSAGLLYVAAQRLDVTLDYFFDGVGSPHENQATLGLVGRNERQVIALVKNFTQITNVRKRSAVAHHVRALAHEARAKARKKPRPKE